MTITVAIIGRPNVGKSTLFNRLVGKRLALVDDTPGVTRDWREGEGRIGSLRFRVIDTAGLEDAPKGSIEARMMEQTRRALKTADIAFFLVDGRAGLTPVDEYFADELRRLDANTILIVNKCEGRGAQAGLLDAYRLGFGEPIPISAEHGEGLSDLHDVIFAAAEFSESETDETEPEDHPLRLAILGRPNVGKSTLVNAMIGEERMITGPEPGLTRDSVSTDCEVLGRKLRIFDTAGLRRKARVRDKVEKLSALDTLRAAQYAEVVVLMIDGSSPMEKQELTIARTVIEEGRALVIAVNKWDAVSDRKEATGIIRDRLETSLPQVRGIPIVTMSAIRGQGIDDLMGAIDEVYERWNKRISTSELNRWLADMRDRHPPPISANRRIRMRYMTQVKARPPTFAIFVSRPEDLPTSYSRYLVNGLREEFGFWGIPLRINYRKGKNPYVDKS